MNKSQTEEPAPLEKALDAVEYNEKAFQYILDQT